MSKCYIVAKMDEIKYKYSVKSRRQYSAVKKNTEAIRKFK
jgi:hypothetical protein